MHINGNNGEGVSLEDALREFIRQIVSEEYPGIENKADGFAPGGVLPEGTFKSTDTTPDEADSAPEGAEEPEEDTPAALEDSEDDSPEIDAVPTMEDAVKRAKEVMTEDGGKARLKTALSAVGATRVSAIPEDKIAEFMEALDD